MAQIKYVALLRSINVGGHNVRMEKLRELFSQLDLINVRTYIQTGNVFFDANTNDSKALAAKIESHLEAALGYDVPTFVRTVAELEKTVEAAPFKNLPSTPDSRHLIVFLSDSLPNDLKLPYKSAKGEFEILKVIPGAAFVLLHLVDGKSGNVIAFIEKSFKIRATVRFYHTTIKIAEAAKG